MKFIISVILLTNALYGKDLLMKTRKGNHFLIRLKNNMTTRTNTGADYNEPPILNICSPKKKGPMNQTNVVPGSGGKIVLKWMSRNVAGCIFLWGKVIQIMIGCLESKPDLKTLQSVRF